MPNPPIPVSGGCYLPGEAYYTHIYNLTAILCQTAIQHANQSFCSRNGAQYCMLARSSGDVVNCRRHETEGCVSSNLIASIFFKSESQSKFQDTDHTKYTVYFYIQTHHVSTYSSHSLLYIFIQFIDILRTYSKRYFK